MINILVKRHKNVTQIKDRAGYSVLFSQDAKRLQHFLSMKTNVIFSWVNNPAVVIEFLFFCWTNIIMEECNSVFDIKCIKM